MEKIFVPMMICGLLMVAWGRIDEGVAIIVSLLTILAFNLVIAVTCNSLINKIKFSGWFDKL